jgi:hypothetical protein
MKKQQISLGQFSKKLSGAEMKKVQGGAWGGIWVCVADFYDCYSTKSQCFAACSVPTSCRLYGGCP